MRRDCGDLAPRKARVEVPYDPRPRTILEGEIGLLIMPMGVAKFREFLQYFDSLSAGGEADGDAERAYRIRVAFNHELVHLLQSITTPVGFHYCEDIRFIAGQLLKYINEGAKLEDVIPAARAEYATIVRGMTKRTGRAGQAGRSVSANDLLEAMAVIESVRSIVSNVDIPAVLAALPQEDKIVDYRRVLEILQSSLRSVATVNLASTVCFLSLSSKEPGETFAAIVNRLATTNALRTCKSPLNLFEVFAPDLSESLISTFANGVKHSKAMIWNQLGSAFASSGEIRLVHLCAAHPSSLLAETNWSKQLDYSKLSNIQPTLSIFPDGAKANPLLTQIGTFLRATSLVGAALSAMSDLRPRAVCGKLDCPVNKTGLCHYHHPPPPDSDWKECAFHDLFQNAFRRTAEEFHFDLISDRY